MAVQSDTSRIQYAGNNSTTTSYAVPFVFQENSHLKAIARTSAGVESVVTLTNHTGAGNVNGGTVRTSVAIPATSTLTIYREVPATQTTTYAEGGDFPAASHERALDKLTYLVQQLGRAVARCVRLTDAAPESSAIPAVANQFFGTDANGAITMVAGVNAAPESITNTSISPTAAIAGTKIAPSFGSQTITSSFNDGFRVNANFGSLKGYGADTTTFVGMVQFNKDADVLFTTEQAIPLIFKTNATERMRIAASGNVSVATTADTFRLHAYHATADCVVTSQGRATSLGGSGKASVQLDVDGTGGFALQTDSTSGTRLFRVISNSGYGLGETTALAVTSGGNVGIGTTSPSTLLDCALPSGSAIITAQCSATTGADIARVVVRNGTVESQLYSYSSLGAAVVGTTSNHPFLLFSNTVERMRIDASGNVGIGTASPSSRLHIAGDLTVSSGTTATTASTTAGGSTLPALAAGYLVVSINGTSRKIPYYAT